MKVRQTELFKSIVQSLHEIGGMDYSTEMLTQLQALDEYVGELSDEFDEEFGE
jgi:hypothetical protein